MFRPQQQQQPQKKGPMTCVCVHCGDDMRRVCSWPETRRRIIEQADIIDGLYFDQCLETALVDAWSVVLGRKVRSAYPVVVRIGPDWSQFAPKYRGTGIALYSTDDVFRYSPHSRTAAVTA